MPVSRGTYSIVAADAEAGEVGVAVQSKYFCVGRVVPWARAGVGAVATQAQAVAAFGPEALRELEAGTSPADVLERLLAEDEGRASRQLGIVTAAGEAAAWTGESCNEWAGHVVGEGFAAQGNILAGPAVVEEMARAFRDTRGPLAERLVGALEAAQAAGGDKRGQQSSALIVERVRPAEDNHGIDRVVDLRVEDHDQPVVELRRLLEIHTRWDFMERAYRSYAAGDRQAANAITEEGLRRFPDDGLLYYNGACYDALAGDRGRALARLRRACELDETVRVMAQGDDDFASLREDPEFRALVGV